MALRVLILPDKFKGTLTAGHAAQAIAEGWRSARPQDSLELLPMSDGGDGFGEIVSELLHAEPRTIKTMDAAHRPCEATWWWHTPSKTAIVEAAGVIGLAQLPPGKYHPFELDTQGLAAILHDAVEHGAEYCIIGIGGSATNDGGFGVARGLGWQFFGLHDEKILRWTELRDLALTRPPDASRWFTKVTVAVDVQNPLLGPRGCTRIYGPQKGLRPRDFEFAESCLEQFASVVEKQLHLQFTQEKGAGAAGGLGYGLRCFAGGQLQPGFELFAEYANLRQRVAVADLIITAEGAIDESSLMGKGVGQLARMARDSSKRCIGFAGAVRAASDLFSRVYALSPDFTTAEEAMARPQHWLQTAARKAAGELAVA